MAASDQVSTLADRAKQAKDNVAAATAKNKADLEAQSQAAHQSAEKHAAALKSDTANAKVEASGKWADLHANWTNHVADIHQKADEKKADLDAKHAERDAEDAEDYALSAVDFAYAAIEEAESAVIDARLARVEADETVGATA
jgi:hypothetical protein